MKTECCMGSEQIKCGRFCVRLYLRSRTPKETHVFSSVLLPVQRWERLRSFLEKCIAPPSRVQDCFPTICVHKGPSLVFHRLPTASFALIFPHSFSVVSSLLNRMAVRAHVLPTNGNMMGFAGQTVARASKAFRRASGVGSMAQLIAPHFWFTHELGAFKVVGSRVDGYAPLEQCTFLEASTRPMHDGAGVDSTALPLPPPGDEAFIFLTLTFLSHWYSLIYSIFCSSVQCSRG